MFEAGFAKMDITPRIGVELCGFGAFINRHSIGVRDRLWARAMALRCGGETAVVISCDLIGVTAEMTACVRARIERETGVPGDAVMVHCTHTHSGPNTCKLNGWGAPDPPYRELLPDWISEAALTAIGQLGPATLSHVEAPCEGMGLNREYDEDAPPLDVVLDENWRPAKPELTDTTCHVLKVEKEGRLAGFCSYFGCHPVVCCSTTRFIHGDYAGVATNLLEREHPGSVGLFLQGAQGDVNSCVVHKAEQEAMLALDVIAARYARSVRQGLRNAQPVDAEDLRAVRHEVRFTRKDIGVKQLEEWLVEREAILHKPGASDAEREVRLAMVYVLALRQMIRRIQSDRDMSPPTEVQGIRIGPVALLASPFETFQAIKNDVKDRAASAVALVMGITNDLLGYAPDREAAARGGYAADMVPMIIGHLPFARIHDELVEALLEVDAALQ